MQVVADVLDVLLDGTITKLQLKTDSMVVAIGRNEPDQNFMIEKIDVADHERVEEALEVLADHLHEYCIYSIDLNCVDGRKTTLNF